MASAPPEHVATALVGNRSARSGPAAFPSLVLSLRLLSLSIVAGSALLSPSMAASRTHLLPALLAGILLGVAQCSGFARGHNRTGELLIFGQAGVWTAFVHLTGGQSSPLFVGYLLEIPLSGLLFSIRGCAVAGGTGALVYLLYAGSVGRPLQPAVAATVLGFLAIATVLTWVLVQGVTRQNRALEKSHSALAIRAESLAEELRLLGDYLVGGLIVLDGLGRVVSMNEAAADLTGVPADKAAGMPWQAVLRVHGEGSAGIVRTLSEGTAQRGLPIEVKRADGTILAVEAELWMSPSPEGRRTYLFLDSPHSTVASADPMRRLGEAVACVSHQIKNSVHALQGFARKLAAEIPQDNGADETAADLVEVLLGLGELADDVLATVSLSQRPAERLALKRVVSSALVLTSRAQPRVTVSFPESEIYIHARRAPLVHALFNLLDNACRVTPPGRSISVRAESVAGHARLEIRDGGPGLPHDATLGSAPVASREGSGLGLLSARRFIEAGGGQLSFESAPSGGTLCRVLLPLLTEPKETPYRRER